MNEVKLSGQFMQVDAHTDGTKTLSSVIVWKTDLEGGAETQFYTDTGDWIKVHADSVIYGLLKAKDLTDKPIQIRGTLNTRILRGIGITENYIEIISIKY